MASVDTQPQPIAGPSVPSSRLSGVKEAFGNIKRKVTTKQGWIGDYDYAW